MRLHTPLRSAFCASLVMASASSKMMSLKPERKMVLVLAKLSIWLRTTPMPLSSDAFSWEREQLQTTLPHVHVH